MAVYEVWRNSFKIGTAGTSSTDDDFVTIADIESFSVSFDNGVEEWTPFDTEGWTRRLMTAKSITISVSGKRNLGDKGNDYLASLYAKCGTDAETTIKWTMYDGTIVTMNVVVNITECGAGDSTNVAPLAADFMSNGAPTITEAA